MTPIDTAAVILFVAIDAMMLFGLYRNYARDGVLKHICVAARERGRAAPRAVLEFLGLESAAIREPAPDHAQVRRQVDALMERRQVEFARSAVVCVAVIGVLRLPSMCVEIVAGISKQSPTAFAFVGVIGVITALGTLRPGLICACSLPWLHSMYMAVLCVVQCPLGSEVEFAVLVYRTQVLICSIPIGMLCPRLGLLAVTYSCLSACTVWSVISSPDSVTEVPISEFILAEVWTIIMRLILFRLWKSLLEKVARQEVRAKLGHGAAASLLGMVCDATVDTDEDFRLKRHEESFSSLLMHCAGKSVDGCPLSDYMQDEGGAVFARLGGTTRGPDGGLRTDMFAGRLRDSTGSAFDAVVYHVPYFDISGAVHHLVGFRERSEGHDEEAKRLEAEALPEAVLADGIIQRLHFSAPHPHESASSDASSQASSVPGAATRTADVALADRLPVSGASDKFRSEFGVDGDGCFFLDLLEEGGEELQMWIRSRAELVRSGALAAPHVEAYGELKMCGPSRGRRNVKVCFPPPGAIEGGEYEVSINLGRGSRPQGRDALGTAAQASRPEPIGVRRSSPPGRTMAL